MEDGAWRMEDGGSRIAEMPSSIVDPPSSAAFNSLQHLKSCLQHGAQEVVDMRYGRVELEHGDAAF